MRTLIKSFILIVLISVLSGFLINQEDNSNHKKPADIQWRQFDSPTKNVIHNIKVLSNNKTYFSGRKLFEFNGKQWILSPKQPPVSKIENLFSDNKNIWVTGNTDTFESDLFKFDGADWQRVISPISNQIASIYSSENFTWIGGDREVFFYNGKIWEALPYPNLPSAMNYIFGTADKKCWAIAGSKLFYFDSKNWIGYLPNEDFHYLYFINAENGFAVSKDKLFQYKNSKWSIHSSSRYLENILRIAFVKEQIWGIGYDGLILQYKKDKWNKIDSPVKDDLYDIVMISDTEGWIVGDNGTILFYSDSDYSRDKKPRPGFYVKKIAPIGKDINDEYGIAIEDFNNDGLKDIYTVCIFEANRLYINSNEKKSLREGRFKDEAVFRNATGMVGDSNVISFAELYLGVGAADIENDGDQDIYLCDLYESNKLLLNDGEGYFRDVHKKSGRASGNKERSNGAIFGDIDNDSDLDLFVTNEYSTNRLFINDEEGYFKDLTEISGLKTEFGGMCAAFGDIDGDNDLDLFVANWGKPNKLYKNESNNEGKIYFKDISNISGIGNLHKKSNAPCFADIDNDGDLDLFVTSRGQSNNLYLNDGTGKFTDVTKEFIGEEYLLSYGASFADFDEDGFMDLYIANVGQNILYKNIEGKKFLPVTDLYGAELNGYSTGTATGDLDNDGDVDMYVSNYINGSSQIYINNINSKNFINVEAEGILSNRDAIGTKLWLYSREKKLLGFREICSGSGYASHSSREVHFGLGENESPFKIVVRFPSGIKKQIDNVKAGSRLKIRELEGFKAASILYYHSLERIVMDREIHSDLIKFLIPFIIIIVSLYRCITRFKWSKFMLISVHAFATAVFWILIISFRDAPFIISTLIPIFSVPINLSFFHFFNERKIMKNLNMQERQFTRDRIARDLHDDLASTISSALIYSQSLAGNTIVEEKKKSELLKKVNSLLMEAADAITQIVWTVSPLHDHIDDLIMRLQLLIADVCRMNELEYFVCIDPLTKDISISQEDRRNIYLIFKEALNNTLKHSRAAKVTFSASCKNSILILQLQDDGCGFTVNADRNIRKGHGVQNMMFRAKEISAKLEIKGMPGCGTQVILHKKMT